MVDNIHKFPSKKAEDIHNEEESKVVSLEKALVEAESGIEEKLLEMWKKNKQTIIYALIVLLVAALGFEGHRAYAKYRLITEKTAFSKLSTLEEKKLFVKKYAGSRLSGFILLEVAGECYNNQQYEEAATYFEKASLSLKDVVVLNDRAQLGFGVASVLAGNVSKGKAVLEKLSLASSTLGAIRAEATYELAILDFESKDFESCKQRIKAIETIPYAGMFVQKASVLRDAIPQQK